MSRRHHHHNVQSYDYDRFNDHSRDTRDRDRQAHAIEYQDDSLSSINSDDESYMHRARGSKEKKSNFYNVKSEPPPPKISKREKTPSETFKDAKVVTSEQTNTQERLGRLESMLEELIKRSIPSSPSPVPNVTDKEILDRRQNQLHLEPRRHSFTTSMWINRIQEISVQNNWNEKNTIQFMAAQMSGIIKAWYNSLPSYNFTWPELKILISKIFPDNVDFVTTLKRLVTRLKQVDEDMNTYYFSKMYLIEACKITGEDAVSCLIDGLNNQEIQEQANESKFYVVFDVVGRRIP